MSDSGSSSINGETRMLERRVSNNRSELNGDGQMNYFLAWFNTWSELQKTDFVPVLARKMSGAKDDGSAGDDGLNGSMGLMSLADVTPGKPPSLFACQVKLFQDWFTGWSDDQKNYLVMRLQDIDGEFFAKYEEHMQSEGKVKEKDYFEPGVPPELVRVGTVKGGSDLKNKTIKESEEEEESESPSTSDDDLAKLKERAKAEVEAASEANDA